MSFYEFSDIDLRGSKSKNAKLDEQKVLEIKKMIRNGVSPRIISEKYSVSIPTISGIKAGRTWNHVRLD